MKLILELLDDDDLEEISDDDLEEEKQAKFSKYFDFSMNKHYHVNMIYDFWYQVFSRFLMHNTDNELRIYIQYLIFIL